MSAGFTFSQEMSTSSINYMPCILSILPFDLSRTTQIASNCPCHESSLLILHQIVVDRLEALVDEVTLDLLHELTNTRTLGLFHNCMWQSRHFEVDVYFLTLREQIDGLFTSNESHRSNLICVYVFVCVFVFN